METKVNSDENSTNSQMCKRIHMEDYSVVNDVKGDMFFYRNVLNNVLEATKNALLT